MLVKSILLFILINLFYLPIYSQFKANYDEAAIKPYQLPELLLAKDGEKIKTITAWENLRRPEIMHLFKDQVYGYLPKKTLNSTAIRLLEESQSALDGKAIRKQVQLIFKNQGHTVTVNVLCYFPKNIENPHVFIGYNFYGNQTTTNDPNVMLTHSWIRNNETMGISENRATEFSRGKREHRWAIEKMIDKGFGLATIYYGDVDPDKNDLSDGIHPLFYGKNQEKPAKNEWGSISAWAWGYSRVLDYLKSDSLTAQSKFIVFGHSRLGKTALWAGATDPRFDLVISNNSGCGGAALSRRKIGETLARINTSFPHWFNGNFKQYNENESALPIDQHMLIALMAPRPVYVASAKEDKWADPKGEYLSAFHASPAFKLYGMPGLSDEGLPEVNSPVHTRIGYHIRTGVHDVTEYDWEQYMTFALTHFSK
jgi:hypothetical protein